MDKQEFIQLVNKKLKLIRIENDLSQDKMSEVIGLSKKTLVEIEKGRRSLTWTGAVCVVTLFEDSDIIQMTFGDDINEIIKTIAFTHYNNSSSKTLGGKLWWRQIRELNGYKIQQNILSQHYRILNKENHRICSSFELDEIERRFIEVTKSLQ
ncbi:MULTISPECIES: helix-turn-helix transcriptional regulator [unclassified Bacillus (in: firmicutes)]|uniref:helix-turn-helix transcriptional regulator n=1 Tax=unclassified Bacillus (in: firmicutes) TaxID=185979 RepID=UPI0023DAF107|nr:MULTISPECIES: helix-turn-helix transcriptional regulator [unclassified Bacillus (in: firmicutes)]MCU4760090.1 helix-turn-helix domain-containing protein [Bacillus cereus]MCU5109549.1 helix-turn-helix domain-containing protein [Bacillus cereus]MCU5342880.1 helix-turn-helix domain-containing protein [Bacillus cereus]MDF2018468.1 helix-turn-helix transcriptional regulator [Bacillus sp. Cr_R3]MDF2032954.1 helix-turn-helix transcriptional regulator [Bacillus sp. Cr_R16]